MQVFTVHRSNRMEQLLAAFAGVVRSAPEPPMTAEVVVVQSKGMERWLSLGLADAIGVWANARFPFPRSFVEEVMNAVLGDEPDAGASFTRESLRWAIAALLPELCQRSELESVARYLEGEGQQAKVFGLADRIANVFDQYAVFRPDLVASWEDGEGDGWQPTLWRALSERLGKNHFGARLARFRKALPTLDTLPPAIPRRVSVFGVSSLPGSYLELLSLLSQKIDIHSFVLSPSQALVAEAKSRARSRDQTRTFSRDPELPPRLGLLTQSMGRVAWETEQLFANVDELENDDVWIPPGVGSALHVLQSDILGLERTEVRTLDPADGSIAVHSCHGPMRELEVLKDQLRALLEGDPSLEPHDIVVMMPDVERHAPFIDAVFGVDSASADYIPYRIADRSRRSTSVVAQALLAVLDTLGSRFGVSRVLDLLKLEPIRDRVGIAADEIPRIEQWLVDVGVRWGVDGQHKSEENLPAYAENTWRFGLERLLLGFAMPGEDRQLFSGRLPYDRIEGQAALCLGRLAELVERLAAWRHRLSQPQTPTRWQELLGELLDDFVVVPEFASFELTAVREAIEEFEEGARRVGFETPIERAVLSHMLADTLERERVAHAFLSGGVTFCALLPMRSIPFRVVCLVGMSDTDFPRQTSDIGFDEMLREPRVGDRTIRDEDRLLFLEAVLSARERLLITYVGRAIHDDAKLPPSVLVGELWDALDARFVVDTPAPATRGRRRAPAEQLDLFGTAGAQGEAPEAPSTRTVVSHPLQAFSTRYFDERREDRRLFSYGSSELAAARALVSEPATSAPLFPNPLTLPALERVDLDELVAFFDHPARFLLERRASLDLRERHRVLEEREPVEPDGLEAHILGQWVLDRVLDGRDQETTYQLTRATGKLVAGTPGRVQFDEYWSRASTLGSVVIGERGGGRARRVDVDVAVGTRRIEGGVDRVWPGGRVTFAYGARPARAELDLWIRHLALAGSGVPQRSTLVRRAGDGAKVEIVRLGPMDREQALENLTWLLDIFDRGQRKPLCFFPRSSRIFADKLIELRDRDKAHRAARTEFVGGREEHAEWRDPYFSRLFPGEAALGDDFATPSFAELSAGVFGPFLLQSEREIVS